MSYNGFSHGDYSIEQLARFINSAKNRQEVNSEDARAAAFALWDLFAGIDPRVKLGMKRRSGQRGKCNDPERIPISHPAFGVAMAWRRGEVKYADAVDTIMDVLGVGERKAKGVLKTLRPRAERMNNAWCKKLE